MLNVNFFSSSPNAVSYIAMNFVDGISDLESLALKFLRESAFEEFKKVIKQCQQQQMSNDEQPPQE